LAAKTCQSRVQENDTGIAILMGSATTDACGGGAHFLGIWWKTLDQFLSGFLELTDFVDSDRLLIEIKTRRIQLIEFGGWDGLLGHGIEDMVFLLDMSAEQGDETRAVVDDLVCLLRRTGAGGPPDISQNSDVVASFLMFREHNGDRPVFLGETALIHFDKQSVFFFAMVALVGKLPEEGRKFCHGIAGSCLAGLQAVNIGFESSEHLLD